MTAEDGGITTPAMDERNASSNTKGRGDGRDTREARLAEALRANLRRRKAAVAAKAKGGADAKGD